MLRTIRIPEEELRTFETRAITFFPREIEDFIIGEVRRGGLDVYSILPTRLDDVDEHDTYGVTLKQIAINRARETAKNMGVKVLGSIHTHPWKRWNGCGTVLSRTDYRAFDWLAQYPEVLATPVMGVCAIYRTGQAPDEFAFYSQFWLKDRSLPLSKVPVTFPVKR